jgi:hypothetical protein
VAAPASLRAIRAMEPLMDCGVMVMVSSSRLQIEVLRIDAYISLRAVMAT